MKNKLFLILLTVVAFTFASCVDDTTAGYDRITHYPSVSLEGDTYVAMNMGDTYVEPGFSAVNGGADVSDLVQIVSTVDPTKPGIYTITYSVVNDEGNRASATRYVVVNDPAADAAVGYFLTDPKSFRHVNSTGKEVSFGNAYLVHVSATSTPGVYAFDDLLAGWYAQRAGYGSKYAMVGAISLDDAGTMTLLESSVEGWGDSADGLISGTFSNGKYVYAIQYASDYIWNVTLNKIE